MGMIFEGSTLSTQVSSGPETRTHICSQQQAEMSKSWSTLAFGLAIVTLSVLALATAQPYESELGYGNGDEAAAELDYLDSIRDLIHQTQKRGRVCIRGGRSCFSPKRNLCCDDFECRCNVFGTNCKCQRPGLFGLGRK